jgi:hypothetical protein
MGDDNELGLLGLDKGGDVVKTILDDLGLSGGNSLLTSNLLSGNSLETGSLFLLVFGLVLAEELEEGSSLILSEGLGELVDSSRDLNALVQDSALALKADIEGELGEASKIALGGKTSTNEVGTLSGLLEKVGMRILPLFDRL